MSKWIVLVALLFIAGCENSVSQKPIEIRDQEVPLQKVKADKFVGCTKDQFPEVFHTEEKQLFDKWPAGKSPTETGRLVAGDVILRLSNKMTQRYYSALSLRGVLITTAPFKLKSIVRHGR